MIINANRTGKTNWVINDHAEYAAKIGADKFFDHFVENEENYKDMANAVDTAPGAALMFMVQTHIDLNDILNRKLVDELTKRLCKDEAEYKKYFSAEACEG